MLHIHMYIHYIKTHDSESRGQEETATRPPSELFTCSTTLKLAIALAKPPLKLLLSYCQLTTFLLYRINTPRMEEIGTTIAKYQPLRALWRPLCNHARRIIPSRPICPLTRELVPSLFEESITRSWSKSLHPFF